VEVTAWRLTGCEPIGPARTAGEGQRCAADIGFKEKKCARQWVVLISDTQALTWYWKLSTEGRGVAACGGAEEDRLSST
jgi:hypothetical protein